MCVYCSMGDHTFKYDPPWTQPAIPSPAYPWHPLIPQPLNPSALPQPWSMERLKEYRDLLLQIHELEEKVGCPCEPNKADYLSLLEQRIKHLEQRLDRVDLCQNDREL